MAYKYRKMKMDTVHHDRSAPSAFYITHQLVTEARMLALMPYEYKRELLIRHEMWRNDCPDGLLEWYAAFCDALELAHGRNQLRAFADDLKGTWGRYERTLAPKSPAKRTRPLAEAHL